MQYQLVDVLAEDDRGKQFVVQARVESVENDKYTVRYLSPTKKPSVFKFEKDTYEIELECIDYFYDTLEEFGYIEQEDGSWFKRPEESSGSEYSGGSEEDTDTDTSLDEEEESEESSPDVQ